MADNWFDRYRRATTSGATRGAIQGAARGASGGVVGSAVSGYLGGLAGAGQNLARQGTADLYGMLNKNKPKKTATKRIKPSPEADLLARASGIAVTGGSAPQVNDVSSVATPAPTRPSYGEFEPDAAYANAVSAAQRGIAAELAALNDQRAQRRAQLMSRFNVNGPTAEEQANLDAQLAGIDSDYNAAGQAVVRNYGAATNEARVQAEAANKIAASVAGDVNRYYDAARNSVNTINNEALAAAAAGTGVGLGNTVIAGESTLADMALTNDGLRESASAADDAAVRSDDLAYLRDSLAEEQANQGSAISKARTDNSGEARRLWSQALAERIRQERAQMAEALLQQDSEFDAQRASLEAERRNLGMQAAQYETGRRDTFNTGRREYDLANGIQDYEDARAAQDSGAASGRIQALVQAQLNGYKPGNRAIAGNRIGPGLEDSILNSGQDTIYNLTNNLQQIAALPSTERAAAINDFWRSGLSPVEQQYLRNLGFGPGVIQGYVS